MKQILIFILVVVLLSLGVQKTNAQVFYIQSTQKCVVSTGECDKMKRASNIITLMAQDSLLLIQPTMYSTTIDTFDIVEQIYIMEDMSAHFIIKENITGHFYSFSLMEDNDMRMSDGKHEVIFITIKN